MRASDQWLSTGTGRLPAWTSYSLNWQYWYRDTDGMGMPTSNFTDAVTVGFD